MPRQDVGSFVVGGPGVVHRGVGTVSKSCSESTSQICVPSRRSIHPWLTMIENQRESSYQRRTPRAQRATPSDPSDWGPYHLNSLEPIDTCGVLMQLIHVVFFERYIYKIICNQGGMIGAPDSSKKYATFEKRSSFICFVDFYHIWTYSMVLVKHPLREAKKQTSAMLVGLNSWITWAETEKLTWSSVLLL